jgi:cyclic pyranopterin phosphate synthase
MAAPERSALSHIDAAGNARMVDVGDKEVTERTAAAEAFVRISPALATAIRENSLKKGNLLETARLAGIMAAKRTPDLIPLCHQLPLDQADVSATLEDAPPRVHLTATVRTHAKTGVEMEALTAVTIAALTVIDMGKAIDKTMVIEGVRILEKRGGRSGTYRAAEIGPA